MHELTERQCQAVETFSRLGNKTKAAKEMGVSRRTFRELLEKAQTKLGQTVIAPVPIPEGMVSPFSTVHYKLDKETGLYEVANEWRRMRPEAQLMEELTKRLAEEVAGKARMPLKAVTPDTQDTLFEFDLFDVHMNMVASRQYNRQASYDCTVATQCMVKAAEDLFGRAGQPQRAVVVLGGDLLHNDNDKNVTPASGNQLDVHVHYTRACDYLAVALQEVMAIACSVAPEVHIVVTPGNHDPNSSAWLTLYLDAYYRNCPNVTVLRQESPRKHMIWGQTALFWSHGDRVKSDDWPKIIAAEFPEI